MVHSVRNSIKLPRDSQISRERKFRRLRLRYPVHLKIESPDTVSELDAMSHDVSIGGLLLETSFVIPDHSRVSFIMKITDDRLVRPVELEGNGEIVRVESRPDQKFRIAVACKGSIRYRKKVRKHPPRSPKSNADHNSLTFVKAEPSADCKVDCLTSFASPTI
jgi:PilZ domain